MRVRLLSRAGPAVDGSLKFRRAVVCGALGDPSVSRDQSERALLGELAEPFGGRVDSQFASGDVNHQVVDAIVAGP